VSSDLTWQLTAAAGYSITEKISALLGYRYLYYDYDGDRFNYDVFSSGMLIGLHVDL